jgi:TonB family protein
LHLRLAFVAALVGAGFPVYPGHARADEPVAIAKPPRLIHFVPAEYPKDKHDVGIAARVLLSIEVGDDGKVGGVEVLESGGSDFDSAAVAAARQFIFTPAEAGGQAIPVKITYRYDFTIVTKMVSLGPQVNFDGVILDRFKKQPLADVTVRIKDLDLATKTDAAGAFSFTDLPPATYKVEIRHPHLVTVLTDETIRPGQKRTMKYYVEQKEDDVDEEVVVRAARIKKEAVETRIRTEEARKVPGTQGDTLKVVQNLPGVGRASFGSGQLIVWGSSPKETRVVVEGVEIPSLYHMGGLRSTINSDLVKSIDLSPGAYGADYGRGLGGLVRIDLAPLPSSGVHGYVAADVMDTSAELSAAVTPRLRLAVAGRIGYLDRLMTMVTKADIGDSFPIPRYDDYQARATLTLRKDEEVSATFLAADDHLRRIIPASDPADLRAQNPDTSFRRVFVSYSRLFDDGSSVRVTPSLGVDHSAEHDTFGKQNTRIDTQTLSYALRGSLRRRIHPAAVLLLGMDVQGQQLQLSRYGSVNQPPREGDIVVFGQRPSPDTAFDNWKVTVLSLASFATLDLKLGNWTLTPGLRFEPTWIEGDHRLPFSNIAPPIGYSRLDAPPNPLHVPVLRNLPNPRVQIAWRPMSNLTLTGGAGVYGQPPDPADMSPVFGNPSIVGSYAVHLTGGFSLKLRPTLTLESVAFYKKLYDLVSRSASPSPPVGQALTQDGTGRVRGLQILLRQELFKGFFGWATYTLSRSERRDHPGEALRLFDYDQTHVLALLASYDIGKGFVVGSRFRYSSGMPRTPVLADKYLGRDGYYEPVFGAHNSIRIPAFYQLDVRAEKAFVMQRTKLSVFIDVQNVTNRKNPEEIIYSEDYKVRSTITGLPTLAVAGARLEF